MARYNRRREMRETIGQYRILDQIGSSAIGDMYRARDNRAGRTVVVRVLNDAVSRDSQRRRQFLEDARAAAAISHPNIAALFEVGETPDLLYLVSEFVPGDTLRNVMGGHPINARRAIDIAAQVADALAHAHAHGMSHGDLSPDTIVVTPKGSAKIMEPGFSAWLGDTKDGGVRRSDMGSLGAILFEMLTGHAPGAGRPGSPGAPPEVEPLLNRMLSDDPAVRIQSAAVAAAELRAIGTTFAARAEPAPAVPPPRAAQPRRSIWWIGALIVLAALAALVWLATRAS